ncbi:MAG: hypothetical protein PHT33_12160 [bacterium]|nr:hypothetical protein [bacterium]
MKALLLEIKRQVDHFKEKLWGSESFGGQEFTESFGGQEFTFNIQNKSGDQGFGSLSQQ